MKKYMFAYTWQSRVMGGAALFCLLDSLLTRNIFLGVTACFLLINAVAFCDIVEVVE